MRVLANGELTGPDDACPEARALLGRLGDKWSVHVLTLLGARARRFNELRRATEGISQRMLTVTLRALEREGLVSRRVFPTKPPQVEYELTPLGRSLFGPIAAVVAWAARHRDEVARAREAFEREERSAASGERSSR